MTVACSTQDIQRFRDRIMEIMGLNFDESKFAMLDGVLRNRAAISKLGQSQYIQWLSNRPENEIRALAQDLTVTETYFLRNIDQFHAFAEIAMPQCIAAINGRRKVNLLSAGCASGEEPYSLAITLQERLPQFTNMATITAIDLNPAMLQKAAHAAYSEWSLRDLSSELRERWFKTSGEKYILKDVIRRAVNFESHNMTAENATFWSPGRFDIVFCRNILMYFDSENAQAAVRRIAESMVPGGYLFLGHAETLRGLSNDFHLCHSHNTFFYQRKELLDSERPTNQDTSIWQPPPLSVNNTNWMEAIQQASERIHALHPAPTPSPNVLEATYDADAQLLKAISLCHSGTRGEAEKVCHELLSRDDCNAGAHYVLALCKEGDGDLEVAAEHNQAAVYLDRAFAMPRLHLGLLLRRKGEHSSAQRHLQEALNLLQKEDTSRILLFGGGFQREALMNLCRAELAAMGDRP